MFVSVNQPNVLDRTLHKQICVSETVPDLKMLNKVIALNLTDNMRNSCAKYFNRRAEFAVGKLQLLYFMNVFYKSCS